MGMLISIFVMAFIIAIAYYLLVSRREHEVTPRDREIMREERRRDERARTETPTGPRRI